MNWDDAAIELRKKLHPDHVRPPAQGKYGSYVDGYHVLSEANRIFGEDAWSYSITRMELVSRIDTGKAGNSQIRVGYMATVRVEIDGTFKEGAAVGSGMSNVDNEHDAHESAVKEAETDALKRALRSYGNTFGLALYDKTQANVGIDPPPFDAPSARDRLIAGVNNQPTKQAVDKLWARGDFQGIFDQLPEPMQNEVKKAKSDCEDKFPDEPAEVDQ